MYKSPFIKAAFIEARVTQSEERQARNLNVVGSRPIVDENS